MQTTQSFSFAQLLQFIAMGGLIAAGLTIASPAHAVLVEHIVAIVNDEIITLSDIEKFEARIKSGGLTDDLLIPDDAAKQNLLKNRKALLQTMIDEKILNSLAKKEGMNVSMERVEQEVRRIAKNNRVSREELIAALKERGIEFSQYQDFIKNGLEHQGLVEKSIQSKIKISEDDVAQEFILQHGQADQAFEFTLAHLYFSNQKTGGSAGAKSRAEAALKSLKDGIPFERLAAEVSEDPNYEEGGMLGTFKSGEFKKEIEATVEKLSIGEFSAVMPAHDGFEILRVIKKRAIPDPRTEKEREHIRASLYDKAFKRQLRNWLEQLRFDAFVRVNETTPASASTAEKK